jgi:hypothetical protein
MLWLGDQLADHGLNDADVAIEEATKGTASEGNPNVRGKSDRDHAEHGSHASDDQDGLASNAIRQAAPVHPHRRLGEGEGGNEETGVEGRISLIADMEPLDEGPGIWEDGGESDRLSQANDGC